MVIGQGRRMAAYLFFGFSFVFVPNSVFLFLDETRARGPPRTAGCWVASGASSVRT
jgi:hypothetical protein